ncbi:MAG: HAD family phosphatase [Pirellulaceae bacterium]
MSPIQFIYFDLGKVLLDFDHRLACRQLADVLGTTEERVWEAVFVSQWQWKYERGELTTAELHSLLCETFEVEAELEAVAGAASRIFTPQAEVIELARRLAAEGRRLGVLSNTCACHWEHCLAQYASFLEPLFERHVLSYKVGAMKPDPAIYQHAARQAEVSPERILLIDDRPENIEGASAAGWDVIHFVGADQLADELRNRQLLG